MTEEAEMDAYDEFFRDNPIATAILQRGRLRGLLLPSELDTLLEIREADEFRDYILSGLNNAGPDPEAIFQFLDVAGSEVDYRRYGETLFDILIAGNVLVPGGSIAQEGDKFCKTNSCLFKAPADLPSLKQFNQVFVQLMEQYKYLEAMFDKEINKILVFIKDFNEEERIKVARMTALWICNGSVQPTTLLVLIKERLIKDCLAFNFLLEVLETWKQEKGLTSLIAALTKSGLESRLPEFLPRNNNSEGFFHTSLESRGLEDIVLKFRLSKLELNFIRRKKEQSCFSTEQLEQLGAKMAEVNSNQDITSGTTDTATKLPEECPIKDTISGVKDTATNDLIFENELSFLEQSCFSTEQLEQLGEKMAEVNSNQDITSGTTDTATKLPEECPIKDTISGVKDTATNDLIFENELSFLADDMSNCSFSLHLEQLAEDLCKECPISDTISGVKDTATNELISENEPIILATEKAKCRLQEQLAEDLAKERPIQDMIRDVKDSVRKHMVPENEVITLIWSTVMAQTEWNKEEVLVADQALKHLKQFSPLFAAFAITTHSELALMVKIQEFCYENMNFLNIFPKIIVLFYKSDIISEKVILKWCEDGHSMKGKGLFLAQLKEFQQWLLWLRNVEEGAAEEVQEKQQSSPCHSEVIPFMNKSVFEFSDDLSDEDDAESSKMVAEATQNSEKPMDKETKVSKNWYRKKTFCFFCEKFISNFARHLANQHPDDSLVKEIVTRQWQCEGNREEIKKLEKAKTPSNNKELKYLKDRLLQLNKEIRDKVADLRNRGNHAYNLKTGLKDEILTKVKPRGGAYKATRITHKTCAHCLISLRAENLGKHLKNCAKNPANAKIPQSSEPETADVVRRRIKKTADQVLLYKSLGDSNSDLEKHYENDISSKLCNDMASLMVKCDPLIREIGLRTYMCHRLHKHHKQTRSKLRDLARLFLLMSEKDESIQCFEDCFETSKFMTMVGCVMELGGFDALGNVKVVGISGRYCHRLKECCDVLISGVIQNSELTAEQKAARKVQLCDFLDLISKNWNTYVGSNCETSRKLAHANKEVLIADDEDIKRMSEHVESCYPKLKNDLLKSPSYLSFEALCKNVIADIILLCRRRPGEVCFTKLLHYSKRVGDETSQPTSSSSEQDLGSSLKIFYVPGKLNKNVPILLTGAMEEAIDLLLASRSAVFISSKEEDLLFCQVIPKILPSGENVILQMPFDGSLIISEITRKLEKMLKKPGHMTCTGLRHNIATNTQLSKRDDTYTENLATFMGHTLHIHHQNYRMPLEIIHRLQVGSRLLQARLEKRNEPVVRLQVPGCPSGATIESSSDLSPPSAQVASEEIETPSGDDTDMPGADYTGGIDSPIQPTRRSLRRPRIPSDTESETEGVDQESEAPKAKKPRWTEAEKSVVHKHFGKFLSQKVNPPRSAVQKIYNANRAIFKRNLVAVYTYINNYITGKYNCK